MSVIAITGSASGIGRATAERLTERGQRVIGVDQRDADVTADLGTAEGRAAAVAGVLERCDGRLDGLVTCAGVAGAPGRPGSLLASVNYFGTVALLEGLHDALAHGRAPAAVAISSNSVTIQPDYPEDITAACLEGDEAKARSLADEAGSMATYPATKLAIARYVRARATTPQWAGRGIRLNAVAPGMIETPLIAEGRADPRTAPLLEALPIPIGRPGEAREVAALIDLLLGEDGGYFCGSVVLMDGGSEAVLRPDDWPKPWAIGFAKAADKFTGTAPST